MDLAASRSLFVAQYRARPGSWPDGPGAWYHAEDWGEMTDPKVGCPLIATGEARARAIDPWANDRAKGRPCPPLPSVNALTPEASVNAKAEEGVNARTAREDMAGYMRDSRAARKLGLTIAEYRDRQSKTGPEGPA